MISLLSLIPLYSQAEVSLVQASYKQFQIDQYQQKLVDYIPKQREVGYVYGAYKFYKEPRYSFRVESNKVLTLDRNSATLSITF
mgnify:CR=1 FL=1